MTTRTKTPTKTIEVKEKYPWVHRRRFLYFTNIFSMLVISYCLGYNRDTEIAELAILMAFIHILGSTGSYVFGAVWQDIVSIRGSRVAGSKRE